LIFAMVVLVGPALAGERIEFTNGHTIIVKSSEVVGDKVVLTFEDGSEIGFPKAMVKGVDDGVRTPRNSARNRVRQMRNGPGGGGAQMPGTPSGEGPAVASFSGSMAGVGYGESITVGYQRTGKMSVSDLVRAMRSSPNAISVMDRGRRSRAGGAGAQGAAAADQGGDKQALRAKIAPQLPEGVR
jgi:hypothetical protein